LARSPLNSECGNAIFGLWQPRPFHREEIRGEIKKVIRGDIREDIKECKNSTFFVRSPLNSLCGNANCWPLTAKAFSQGRNKGRNNGSHKGRHKGRYKGMQK